MQAITLKKIENKSSQMGHTKKKIFQLLWMPLKQHLNFHRNALMLQQNFVFLFFLFPGMFKKCKGSVNNCIQKLRLAKFEFDRIQTQVWMLNEWRLWKNFWTSNYIDSTLDFSLGSTRFKFGFGLGLVWTWPRFKFWPNSFDGGTWGCQKI